MQNKQTLFWGALIAALICLAISIYYILPGYDHLLVTHDSLHSHPTHAFAFFALTLISVVVVLVTRPKATGK